MKTLWGLLLVLSLGLNCWMGNRLYRHHRDIRQGAAYLSWQSDHAVNRLAELLKDGKVNLSDEAYRTELLRMLERAQVNAEDAGSTMTSMTRGIHWQVMNRVGRLAFALPKYQSATLRGEQEPLKRLGAHLKAAGWPRIPVHRDSEAEWTALAGALEHLLRLEGE